VDLWWTIQGGGQLKVHEYQAKELLRAFGVPTPAGEVAETPAEARSIAERLEAKRYVVKAQIHAGGRGKGGGVKLADTPEAVEAAAEAIRGMTLVTPQTGPGGKLVRKVLVEEASAIAQEYYLGMVLDRQLSMPVLIASASGGMAIEEVSAKNPELILKEPIDPLVGYCAYQGRQLAYRLGLPQPLVRPFTALAGALVELFQAKDCSLAEINPLVRTEDGKLLALDAKLNFDDSALFRHPDVAALRDPGEEEPLEIEAAEANLNYIKLDGNIGCMVNGAGLAMATMDIIKLAGGEPANFLDVGGGANEQSVTAAFRILLADKAVRAVLINIFGGIVRCDRVANGIVAAADKLKVSVPIVVRLKGTNMEEGRRILRESSLDFAVAEHMKDAAELVVAAAQRAA